MSEPDQIKLEDLTRGELIELVKLIGRPISQKTLVGLKRQSAGEAAQKLGKKCFDLSRAADVAFDAYLAEKDERRRSELHIKWIDAKKVRERFADRKDAALLAESRLWEKSQALDFEAGAV